MMAEDANMLDEAMDIDADAPPVPSTSSTSATTPRSPLLARRNVPNANEKRGTHQAGDSLKPRPDSKVIKFSATPNTVRDRPSYSEKQRRKMIMASAQRNRKLRIQQAIANGSFQLRSLGYEVANQVEPEQLERLTKDLVTQALYAPVPGMAFDPTMHSFSEDDMSDLVQALEAYQMHLARKGKIVLSDKAGPLLRSFARDVLAIVLLQPEKISADDFWTSVALDYEQSKKLKWLTVRVTKLLESTEEDAAPKRGKISPFAAHVNMVVDALKAPGKHPILDKVRCTVHPSGTLVFWHYILTALSLRRLLRPVRTCRLSSWPSRPPYDASWAISRPRAPDTWPISTTPFLILAAKAASALTSPRRASAFLRETKTRTPPPRMRTMIFRVASSTVASRTIPRSRRRCLPPTPSGSW